MPLVSDSVANFINGVSQQPYALRLSSQAEVQENALSSVVEGLSKRPPTKHVAKVSANNHTSSFLHTIVRDLTEQYALIITDGDLKVYDLLTGTEKTVDFPDGADYLTAASPVSSFAAVTVADYTFIVNKTVECAMASTVQAARVPEAIVWVKQAAYSCVYTIKVDANTVSYTTSDTAIANIRTDNVAAQLVTLINAISASPYVATQYGSSIHIRRTDNGAFTVYASDSAGDQALIAVKGKVQSFTDLPARAVDGFQVEVTGDPTTTFDNFYVAYSDSGSADKDGSWGEIPQPGRTIALDRETMPHGLRRNADGTFTFMQLPYTNCTCGDSGTSGEPSFIGETLNDVFFFRNRLGFTADENVILSTAGDYYNFWRATVSDTLDGDPIDIASTHTKVSILRHAVAWNESLLLFSDKTQFRLNSEGFMSPRTVSLVASTEYDASANAKPIGAGKNVYFTADGASYDSVWEYYVDGITKVTEAQDVTKHVPKYLPASVFKLTAATNQDIIAAICTGDRQAVFVYRYYFAGNEKAQSSWSRWTFPDTDTILNCDFVGSTLWLLIQRDDGLYLEKMEISAGITDTGLEHVVLLDRRVEAADCDSVTYDAGTGLTTIVLPYPEEADMQIVAGDGNPLRVKGSIVPFTVVNETTLTVVGSMLANFYAGRKYTMRYRLSALVIRQEAPGGGQTANVNGRLQVLRFVVSFGPTGYLRAEVTPFRRELQATVFSGRTVGSAENPLGSVSIGSGTFSFSVNSENTSVIIDFVNDTPLPCRLLSGEWRGQFTPVTQRING